MRFSTAWYYLNFKIYGRPSLQEILEKLHILHPIVEDITSSSMPSTWFRSMTIYGLFRWVFRRRSSIRRRDSPRTTK